MQGLDELEEVGGDGDWGWFRAFRCHMRLRGRAGLMLMTLSYRQPQGIGARLGARSFEFCASEIAAMLSKQLLVLDV